MGVVQVALELASQAQQIPVVVAVVVAVKADHSKQAALAVLVLSFFAIHLA